MQELDDKILLFVNSFHNEYFDHVMWLVSNKWVWIPFYLALIWLIWYRFGVKGLCLVLAAVGLTFAITDHVTIQVFRGIFCRMRPSNPDNPISPLVHIVNEYRSGKFGFPSAHASNSAGLAVALALFLKERRQSVLLAAWVVLVCYSRMYLGVHYLGDLLAGALFGAMVAGAVYWAARQLPWKLTPMERSQGIPSRLVANVPALVCCMTVLGICLFGL